MPAPGVIEFKNKEGKVAGRVGPRFYSPLEFAMIVYRSTQWRRLDLVKCVAIAKEESWLSPNAEGDLLRVGEKLPDGRHWGPSFGVLQVRTIKEDTGKGTVRDYSRLQSSTEFQIVAAYTLFTERKNAGKDGWTVWGAYNSKAYEQHLELARKVVGTLGVPIA
jgi:hypothetical protein